MGSRYVPPALRNRDSSNVNPSIQDNPSISTPDADRFSPAEIGNYYSAGAIQDARGKTLHDSAATPGELSCVLLFKGANPRWDSSGIIFVKTSLELLPAELADEQNPSHNDHQPDDRKATSAEDGKPAPAVTKPAIPAKMHRPPIAVFSQTDGRKGRCFRNFQFNGYYRIDKLTFLEPHSRELTRMLEQKWTFTNNRGRTYQKGRSEEAWTESMAMRWAVVKFVKDDAADGELGVPKIERLDIEEDAKPEKKGVTEMLKDMRLDAQDGAKSKNVAQGHSNE